MTEGITENELHRRLEEIPPRFKRIRAELGKRVFGQEQLIEALLLPLLCRSHCMLTGVPGLAKTMLIKSLS